MNCSESTSPKSVRDIVSEQENNDLPTIGRSSIDGQWDETPNTKHNVLRVNQEKKKILPESNNMNNQDIIKPPISPQSTERRGRFIIWPTSACSNSNRTATTRWRTTHIRRRDRNMDGSG